ncbi:DMP19 family protein [Neisseria sp. 83E34]|uniref:DMP19 family protein n=1 Tax=Neisseria sp. 83E34 TaxID=1692264 RepID=UPI0012E1E118|nr:DMP19 family protein [Neisseria sp. 83E34]
MLDLNPQSYDSPEQFIYTLADYYFAYLETHGDAAADRLTDEQHTLMAYVYLDSQVQEGGFVQLIASGYGEYVLLNPLADSLRRWKIKPTPKILDQAKALYQKYGEKIEHLSSEGAELDSLRTQFPEFEELDADYYDCAEADMAAAAEYIAHHATKFSISP